MIMRYRPADDVAQEQVFQVAESTVTDTNRSGVVQLAVDKPGSVLIFQNAAGVESDLIKRLGVAIITMEMDLE